MHKLGTLRDGNLYLMAPAIVPSDYINNYALEPGIAKEVIFPEGAKYALFSGDSDFYVRWDGGEAALPASDVVDGSSVDFSPALRVVENHTGCSLVSQMTCKVQIGFYF